MSNTEQFDAGAVPAAEDGVIAPVPRVTLQGFCETNEIAAIVQAAIAERRMDKVHAKVQMGGPAAAVEAFRESPTPNVIVLETVTDARTLIGHLDSLSESCDAGTKVIVIGHVNDIQLYRDLMRRGISDYLIAPTSPEAAAQFFKADHRDRSGEGHLRSLFQRRWNTCRSLDRDCRRQGRCRRLDSRS